MMVKADVFMAGTALLVIPIPYGFQDASRRQGSESLGA